MTKSKWLAAVLNFIPGTRAYSRKRTTPIVAGVILTAIVVSIAVVGNSLDIASIVGNDGKATQKKDEVSKTAYQAKDIATATTASEANQHSSTPEIQPAPQPVKYSTSSDPRSTAYSTTPPPPNPANVDIKITHNGQVAAGTLISYNATKGEKTYYGGDLVLSTSNIIFSSNSGYDHTLTVSTPDGATITMPTSPWNDTNPNFSIGMEISQYKSEGTSFNMLIDKHGVIGSGSYQLHITAHRVGQAADAWQYDAFITVQVL